MADSSSSQRRLSILRRCQNVAGPIIQHRSTWEADDISKVKTLSNANLTGPMRCSVIGMVSSNDLHLENHGDFGAPTSTSYNLSDACFHLSLQEPDSVHHGDNYVDEYRLSTEHILRMASTLPESNVDTSPALEYVNGSAILSFSRKIFNKVHIGPGRRKPLLFNQFPIRIDLQKMLIPLRMTHTLSKCTMVDENNHAIANGERNERFRGQLVKVVFTIEHHPDGGLMAVLQALGIVTSNLPS